MLSGDWTAAQLNRRGLEARVLSVHVDHAEEVVARIRRGLRRRTRTITIGGIRHETIVLAGKGFGPVALADIRAARRPTPEDVAGT